MGEAKQLVFFFGRHPALSLGELLFFLQDKGFDYSIEKKTENLALVSFNSEVDETKLVRALGGTAKIARVLFSLEKMLEKEISNALESRGFFEEFSGKFFYSAGALTGPREQEEYAGELRAALKQGFKAQRVKAMFKHPKPAKNRALATMAPSEIKTWRLLDAGFELLVLPHAEKFLFCKTVAATDVRELKEHDALRPEQKPKHAISIRLARIMLNLAGAQKGKTVLDTFCGIGTIMQEALANGASAIGLELDPATAAAAERNLEWFCQRNKIQANWRVLNADSAKISRVLKRGEFDCVATEPFMGELVFRVLPEAIVKKNIASLEQLYSAVFAELSKIMEKGQRIAFILPSIPATNSKKISASESVFQKAGFACINPSGEKIFPFRYEQKGSRIVRRIYVLEKS